MRGGGSGWGVEEVAAGEGEVGSEGRGPAGGVGVGGTERGDDGQKWDEDDDEAGNKGGFCGGGAGEASGLELVACGEEEADDGSGGSRFCCDFAELAVVNDGQGNGGEGHAKKIKKEGRGVLEGVFYEDEGSAPDDDYGQKEEMGEGGVGDSLHFVSYLG